jgi:hypothetical protein
LGVLEESEHMKPKPQQPRQLLGRSIRLARKLERISSNRAASRLLTRVGYGFLLRSRRLGTAIEALPSECSYEALILVRTLLEIFFEYQWIRLKRKHSRAVRFLRYQPIDKLKCLEAMPTVIAPPKRQSIMKRLKGERSKTRHLFRFRDKNGTWRWARSWAYPVSSIAGRVAELRLSAPTTPNDNYWYGLYRWMSWIVHASPQSLEAMLSANGTLKPRQPLEDPSLPLTLAWVLLLSIVGFLADDLKLAKALEPELSRLIRRLKAGA